MLSAVLQTAGGATSGWVGTVLQASDVVGALLGLFIAYQAFRGYRRNRSRPMLFISLGFVLVLGVPFTLFVVFLLVRTVPRTGLAALIQVSEITGLSCIVYALHMQPDSDRSAT
ncbi:DUF7521 family protein [Halococcus agarilyticus]|uniref:DUF7521 family protein n=1 Tax=Halococcus agarilyticus TaxID=1232219 RepID=UPI0006778F4F|nr:hypothetical protein [Halococcus agarilyticus]